MKRDECHEHTFVEELTPTGRLIVGPCLGCNLPALEALLRAGRERDEWKAKYEATPAPGTV